MFNIGAVIGKIFGTEKALDSMVNGLTSGIDKLVYTTEEKADDASAERSEARKMVIQWMDSTKGQNIARRLIALSIVSTWLFQYFVCMFLNVIAIWITSPQNVTKVLDSAIIVGKDAEKMNGAVMLILGFYFFAPHMGKAVDAAIKKLSNGA